MKKECIFIQLNIHMYVFIHSAYEMFSWYKYLIVGLVFSRLGFWSGNLFLIAPFPDLCLLVPFYALIVLYVLFNEGDPDKP